MPLVYCTSIDIRASRGASITGDEPFYLITTQSLLQDGDLDLRNQYATRSYESFFDDRDGLWTQSVPLADGRVLSPHNVGLSLLLLLPGFAIDGLVGVQVQLVLIAALTWALAYVLALRLSGARPWLVWLATLAVALSATAFIYSSEVYPELPAGLALVGELLVATGRERLSPTPVRALMLLLSALPWLGAKYAPLSALVALYVLLRAEPKGRARAGRGRDAVRALLRRVPPRDVRIAHPVQRESRIRGRFDGHHRRGACRGRRTSNRGTSRALETRSPTGVGSLDPCPPFASQRVSGTV